MEKERMVYAMRVAIPTQNGQIFLQYGQAKEFTVYDVEIELVKEKTILPLGERSIADFLTHEGINAVICANIRSAAEQKRTPEEVRRLEVLKDTRGSSAHSRDFGKCQLCGFHRCIGI